MATQSDVARHLFLTTRRVRELVEDGHLPAFPKGEWDVDECRRAYIEFLKSGGRPAGDKKIDPVQARARKDSELADKTALENAKRRGELLEADDATTLWVRLATECKTRFLALPSKLAPIVIGKSREQARAVIEQSIYECLTAFADARGDDSRGDAAASKTDRKRVGRRASKAKSRSERGTRPVVN